MGITDKEQLARSFQVHPDLVPHISELLGDLWSLGFPPDRVVSLLRPLGLPPGKTKVLDLGCGKGAVAIELARELGFRVTGIDIFPPFIEEARRKARERGVDELCRFIHGDIRQESRRTGPFDVAVLIWVGDALGDLQGSVECLRRQVVPGGKMIIAQGYLKEGVSSDPAHLQQPEHEEALRQLAFHGDVILEEKTVLEEDTAILYGDYIHALRRGAERISRNHPELLGRLREHLAAQEKMCELLKTRVVPAAWLLMKTPAG